MAYTGAQGSGVVRHVVEGLPYNAWRSWITSSLLEEQRQTYNIMESVVMKGRMRFAFMGTCLKRDFGFQFRISFKVLTVF
jgi:hypothetical protein